MLEIYTPKSWYSVFNHSPMLVIDDEGYIYTKEEYQKVYGRTRCGKIEYERGEIYGKDYDKIYGKCPIGYIKNNGSVMEIYDKYPAYGVAPIYFIENNKIYTRNQYYGAFGKTPSGYIEEDDTVPQNGSQGGTGSSIPSSSHHSSTSYSTPSKGSSIGTIIGFIILAIFVVAIYETGYKFPMYLGVSTLLIPIIVLIYKLCKRKWYFYLSLWQIPMCVVVGVVTQFLVYLFWALMTSAFGAWRDNQVNMLKYAEIGSTFTAISAVLIMFVAAMMNKQELEEERKKKRKKKANKRKKRGDRNEVGTAQFCYYDGDVAVYRCPVCGDMLGVPRGRGRITIICRNGHRLSAET